MTVFLDSNIILDILMNNEEFYKESKTLLSLADNGFVDFFISASSITDIYYIANKYIKDERKVRACLIDLLGIISIAGVDEACIKNALNSSWRDFEDAVQNEASIQIGADYFVTRNAKDYKATFSQLITPSEFLSVFGIK